MTMNMDQIKSLIRTVLAWIFAGTVGAWAVKHLGITIDDSFLTVMTGVVAGVVSLVWSQITHKTPA